MDIAGSSSVVEQQIELACRFYGLNIDRLSVGENENNRQVIETLKGSGARAIVITGNALPDIDKQEFLSALQKELQRTVPLLIADVTPACDENVLRSWSDGAVVGCINSTKAPTNGFYKVADLKNITRQLAGQDIPFNTERGYHFVLKESKESQAIMQVANNNKEGLFPVFVKTIIDRQEVFFQVGMSPSDSAQKAIWEYDSERFFEIAPLMMFLRHSCGERCWHSVGHYANLTIDDPWLTESYGHLSYKGLLREMQKANFHTTIAFIPWNYDRSESEVVSLFRKHPERLSICMHGNNHDHYEFYKYKTNTNDPWPAKPINVQEANIKQAIARMEKFRNLTNLPYDRVMIFPHGIAPSKTLGLLKKYNFWATVNASNVPLGSQEPKDTLFHLRPVALDFENFPSLNRYSPNKRSQSDIAIDLFLDNPILFYAHHDFFENGIDAFNNTAQLVNNIQPHIEWQNLGYIVQHLYIEKLREDGNYDVMAFTSNLIIKNTHNRNTIFFIYKEESFSPPIKQLTVDGHSHPYDKSGSDLIVTISIPAGESRHMVIEYGNDLDLASIDVSKNDPRVNRLRKLSDFRDITLSKNVLGRTFTHVYYETGLFKLGLKRLVILFFVLAVLITFGGWYLRRRLMKR